MPNDLSQGVVAEKVDILIVDDLPEKLLVLETVLQSLGQNLVLARSGAEALREILKREFAVILLDVNMPDIDGIETASLIRRYKKSAYTPIIFITAYADEVQTQRGYALGAVDYIFSPVIPEVLRSKVKVFVDLHQAQRRIRDQAEERIALVQAEAARLAAEENSRRINFLARASHELGASLDRNHCASVLLRLLVPDSAALAVLLMLDEGDNIDLCTMCAARQPGGGVHIGDSCAIPSRLSEAAAAAVCGGERRLSPAQLAGMPQWPQNLSGGVVLPLSVGGRVLGALVVATEAIMGFDEHDIAVFEQLAERAAVAFDNARLYSNLQKEIVDRQEAEFKLEEAARRKDEFLAMLSHELRNPLAPIRGAVEVMRRIAPAEEKLSWARDVIERQVGHLTRLVDELLDVARIASGKVSLRLERIELAAVVQQAVETARPLIEARRHELQLRLPPQPLWLAGDLVRLSQVVANLLNNAAKYTPEGGRIEVEAGVQEAEIFIRVRDNGIGIEPDLLSQMFDLFAQGARSLDRSQGGLGVGLTLVRHLVQLHGGRVEGRSKGVGAGSEFAVFLPSRPQGAGALAVPAPAPAAAARTRRVLVVDDNRDAAESIAMMLNLEGHKVEVALSGPQALQQAPRFLPEVVLLDIGLPEISGYEVARRLQDDPRMCRTLLIALTGYGQPEDLERTIASGFHHHFIKPVESHRILEAIERWSERFG